MLAATTAPDKRPQAPARARSSRRVQTSEAMNVPILHEDLDMGSLSLAQLSNRSPLRSPRAPFHTLSPFRASTLSPSDAFTRDQFGGKTRDELERLLVAADEIIRNKERDLAVVARVGQQLLEHNNELKDKHEALATRVQKDSGARLRTPSLILSPSISHLVHKTSANRTPDPQETKKHERRRDRTLSSRSSISSVQSLSDLIIPIGETRKDSDVEALSSLNAELAVQLEELQAEASRDQVIGNKRVRKLTKEIAELKEEFRRAVKRNAELEAQLKGKPESSGLAISLPLSQSTTSMASSTETFYLEEWPGRGESSQEAGQDAAALSTDIDQISDNEENSTPVRLQPPRNISFSKEFNESLSLVEENAEFVFKLREKIAELEEANEEIGQDREHLQARLDQVEADFVKMRESFEKVLGSAKDSDSLDRQTSMVEAGNSNGEGSDSLTNRHAEHMRASTSSTGSAYTPHRPSHLSAMTLFGQEEILEQDATDLDSPTTSPLSSRRWSKELRTLGSELGHQDLLDRESLIQEEEEFEAELERSPSALGFLRREVVLCEDLDFLSERLETSEEPFEFLSILHGGRPGGIGQDYWPISRRARYRPSMLVRRVSAKALDIAVSLFYWIQFLACLGLAVYSTVKKGPRQLVLPRRKEIKAA